MSHLTEAEIAAERAEADRAIIERLSEGDLEWRWPELTKVQCERLIAVLSAAKEPERELWNVLHEWHEATNPERIDALEHEINRLFRAPQPETPKQPDSVHVTCAVPSELDTAALCDGYSGSACFTDRNGAKIVLHYETGDQGEAAYLAITDAIDAALAAAKGQQ